MMGYEIYVMAFSDWRESVLLGRSLGTCFYMALVRYSYLAKALAYMYLNNLNIFKAGIICDYK